MQISNPVFILEKIKNHYADSYLVKDELDGLSMEFKDWRFNLRISNTEPLMRLNVEAKPDMVSLEKKIAEAQCTSDARIKHI